MKLPDRIQARVEQAPRLFHHNDKATFLEIDADSLIYKVAATTNSLETAKRRLVAKAMELHFLADAAHSRLHLTPKHCTKAGRKQVLAHYKYQGNRDKGKAPQLVEPLRYVVGRGRLQLPPEFSVVFNDTYEADDSVVMNCHIYEDAIYYSEDKDLDCLRNRKLCQHTLQVLPEITGLGWLGLKQMAQSKKVVGRGPVFFWAQMLMGDSADHIKGLEKLFGKNCGAVKSIEYLQTLMTPVNGDYLLTLETPTTTTEQMIAKAVIIGYMENKQNPWPEGWLLWLHRSKKYNFLQHIRQLKLLDDPDVGHFLRVQFNKKWFEKVEE